MKKAGNDIDAYCGHCKLVLAHVIIANKGGKPVRVECKTCRAVHAFRTSAPEKKLVRRSTSRQTVRSAGYEELIAGRDLARAVKYKPAVAFRKNDVVDHKIFGLGVVHKILSGGKVEVVFQAGAKVLVHAAS